MARRTETFDVTQAYRAPEEPPHEFRHAKRDKKVKSPLWARLCVVLGLVALVLSSVAYGGQLFLEKRYDNNIARADLLGDARSSGKKAKFPLNFLVIGTDKRTAEDFDPKDSSSRLSSSKGERADSIIFMHVPQDKKRAYVVSIPRDTDLDIPAMGDYKGGKDKINAAYAFGGAPLLVATVNQLLGVTIDYPIIVHFKAVRELTDVVGGVDVVVEERVRDPRSRIVFQAGPQHLDGKTAEAYVRQRYGLANGDYDRQKRQQQFLFALMNQVTQTNVLTNPKKLDKLLITATENLTVDQSMPVQDLVLSLKNLRPDNAIFLGLQMLPSEKIDGVYYEFANETAAAELGQAIETSTMPAYLAKYPPNDVSRGR
ncbi:MAG: LCP family protein [Mycobacteriales bacterium]